MRGSCKPSKALRPIPAGIQGKGPVSHSPAVRGQRPGVGMEEEQRGAYSDVHGGLNTAPPFPCAVTSGKTRTDLCFSFHICERSRVIKHPS